MEGKVDINQHQMRLYSMELFHHLRKILCETDFVFMFLEFILYRLVDDIIVFYDQYSHLVSPPALQHSAERIACDLRNVLLPARPSDGQLPVNQLQVKFKQLMYKKSLNKDGGDCLLENIKVVYAAESRRLMDSLSKTQRLILEVFDYTENDLKRKQ